MATKLHCDNCDKVTKPRASLRVTIQPHGFNVQAAEPTPYKFGDDGDNKYQVLCVDCMRQLLIEMAAKLPQTE